MLQHSKQTSKLIIQGGYSLHGTLEVQGSKNAVLVSICALLLAKGISILRNVPCITDVFEMIKLIEHFGAKVSFDTLNHILSIDTSVINSVTLTQEESSTVRTSILLAAPLLALNKWCRIGLPGGDKLGSRPIDYHLYAFKRLGCTLLIEQGMIEINRPHPQANRIVFEYPSVGATENALMLAAVSPGITTIINAAIEPEVMELVYLLKSMGAVIYCEPYATLVVHGVEALLSTDYTIFPDRLEVGTLLIAAAATQGSITLSNAQPWHLELFLTCLENMGNTLEYDINKQGISLKASTSLKPLFIRTGSYPGFPTDLQALMVPLLTQAHGYSSIYETVYHNRFQYVKELQTMGAQLKLNGTQLSIKGPTRLKGSIVHGSDIRATACLVIAGLISKGKTVIKGVEHLKRGYQALDTILFALGANISWQD